MLLIIVVALAGWLIHPAFVIVALVLHFMRSAGLFDLLAGARRDPAPGAQAPSPPKAARSAQPPLGGSDAQLQAWLDTPQVRGRS